MMFLAEVYFEQNLAVSLVFDTGAYDLVAISINTKLRKS